MHPIYLDNAATTPLLPEVAEAMAECYGETFANPASQHSLGRKAKRKLEDAREAVLEQLEADPETTRLITTSGGTEANNLAIFGLHKRGETASRIILSPVEHPSIHAAAEAFSQREGETVRLKVDRNGIVDLNHLRELLEVPARLVSVMLGNNETGVLQPIREIAEICRSAGVPFHTDAAQAVGKMNLDVHALGVDALTIAPHKFHGPIGIGGLLLREELELESRLYGGAQQMESRPGTESVALAVGMATALRLSLDQYKSSYVNDLRNEFERRITEQAVRAKVLAADADRLPHISQIAFLGLNRQAMFMALDLAGVACSMGSACASGSAEQSRVHREMGLSEEEKEGALRFSFSSLTQLAEMEQAVRRILKIEKDLRSQ